MMTSSVTFGPHMGNTDANIIIKILEKRKHQLKQCFAIKFKVTFQEKVNK